MRPFLLMIAALAVLFPGPAFALCANPAGTEGELIYNSTHKVVQFCNGTLWIATGGQITEVDPKVGTLTANKWCIANPGGAAIDCTQDDPSGGGDDLGNHTAAANIQLGSFYLSGDGGNEGIRIDADGKVGIGGSIPVPVGDLLLQSGGFTDLLIKTTGTGTDSSVWLNNPDGTWRIHGDRDGGNALRFAYWTAFSEEGGTIADGSILHLETTGLVGIGTNDPKTQLDVQGTLSIGNGAEACNADLEGAIKYDAGTDEFYFCRTAAGGWQAAGSGGGADNLGNHTATANINLGANWLNGDAGSEGLSVGTTGQVRVDYGSATYDIWLQGGPGTSGTTRRLGLLGTEAGMLYLNYASEYASGVTIGGPVIIAAGALSDNSIVAADIADDAVTIPKLAATGTASSSTFLRGDNTWAAPSGGGVSAATTVSCALSGTPANCTVNCAAGWYRSGCALNNGVTGGSAYPSGSGCRCQANGGTCYIFCVR